MREDVRVVEPDLRLASAREGALHRLGHSMHLPALQRLALVEELASDVEGLAGRLEAGGLPSAEARRRALQVLTPSPEAVSELEQLHGRRRPQTSWPTGLLALAGGWLLLWGLPPEPGAVTLPVALAGAVAVAGAAGLVRHGWSTFGEDPLEWRRALRLHLASLVVLWSATLLGSAVAVQQWLGLQAAEPAAAAGAEAAGELLTLVHPLLALFTLGTAVTLVAVVHLTLLFPRVAGRLRSREAVEEILQILLHGSR